ncbi:MAG: helix-turn-helix transcriptional regulator [Gemmatimonadota bacterium]
MITKTQRWLDLIAFLVGRRVPAAVEDIMEGVPSYRERWADGDDTARASVRRMFERDKDELRELGVPIRTVPYSIDYGAEELTGYRLATRDFYLPYLRVLRTAAEDADGDGDTEEDGGTAERGDTDERGGTERAPGPGTGVRREGGAGDVEITAREAGAAIDALTRVANLPDSPFADASRSALRKLAFDLDLDALEPAPVLYLDPPGTPELGDRIRTLLDAVRARKTTSFTYYGIYRDTTTDRTVHPYGLLFHRHWYLVGHDELRDDLRVFRLGRMDDVEVNPKARKTPDYDIPDSFDLEALAGRRPWELDDDGEPVTARVRFAFPASLWADRNGYGTLLEALEDGAAIRALEVHQPDPFLRWVLSQAGDATVVGPPELVDAYHDLVRRTAELYEERS